MQTDNTTILYDSVDETPPVFRVIAESNDYWTEHLLSAALRLMNAEIDYKWDEGTEHDVGVDDVDVFHSEDAHAYGLTVDETCLGAEKVAQLLPMTITRHQEILDIDEVDKPFDVDGGISSVTEGMIYVLDDSGLDENEIVDLLPSVGGWERTRTTR